jgi:Yip1-like protein
VAQTMTESAAATGSRSLPARFVGILFSPRATYADVAAHPRWLGMFLTVLLITGAATTALMSTEIGRNAIVERQQSQAEDYGRPLNQAQLDTIVRISSYYVYIAPALQFVFLTLGSLLAAGIALAVFNALLGGDARFKQVYAVVAHSGVVLALLSLFSTPLAYARESVSGVTNLGVFLPFLDERSFAARLLGSIDLTFIWWILSLSIGLGVLYRKRTGPIATTMLVVYVVIGLVIAAIKSAASGA